MTSANKAAIVGVYTTEQGRRLERTNLSLLIEAVKGALDDAGLTLTDVDGVVAPLNLDPRNPGRPDELFWAGQFGGRPLTYTDSAGAHLGAQKAAAAIEAGLANVVVLFEGKANLQIGPSGAMSSAPRADLWHRLSWGGYMTPWYALWARRYMHEFGATSEDLAQVGVIHRYHATLNPDSLMGKKGEITVDDVLASRMIADPLHLLDCALDNDGGWAIVIASAEVARNCKKKPISIIGGALGMETDAYQTVDAPWIRADSAVRRSGDIAFAQAGVSREDIDVANLYDCFSITFLRDLEELGFCKPGEAPGFVREGNTRLGGSMPCNTDGGLLSNTHMGNATGLMTVEVVRQLRGECGARQVPGAKLGLSFNQGAAVHGYSGTLILAAD